MLTYPSPLMLGIEGARPTRAAARLIRETGACSVLLLARNIESPAQLRRLTGGLQDMAGRPILFAIDHEGGWVLRFASGLTAFPGNGALGAAADPGLAYRTGRQMALELKAMGIGLNLAPVLDVSVDRYNPGIGIRSFGKDPALVSRLGAAFIRGMQEHGVAACAKHFPGKGAASVDAHVSLPVVPLSRARMAAHLAPFRAAAAAGVDCLMTSHAVFPGLDRSRTPATFSPRVVGLARRMGFTGTVISDDLCMGAVAQVAPIQRAAVDAFAAGHDLLIIAHAESLQREAAEALAAEAAPSRLAESARRLKRLLARRRPRGGPMPEPAPELALAAAREALEVLRRGDVPLPLPLGPGGIRRLAVLWPDFRQVRDRFTFEGGPEAPLARLKARLARWPARCSFVPTPVTGEAGAQRAAAAARRADAALFFCFEAMRFPGQRATLEALKRAAPDRTVACLLRSPWDASLLSPRTTALHAHGYRDCQITALLEALR